MFVATRMSISPSHGKIGLLLLANSLWCLNGNVSDFCSSAKSSLEVDSMSNDVVEDVKKGQCW